MWPPRPQQVIPTWKWVPLFAHSITFWLRVIQKRRSSVTFTIVRQLDSLESPRQQLWHSVQEFLDEANRGGKTYRPSQRPGTRTEREEKANGAPVFVSLCFLTAGATWPAILLPWLRLPCRIGPYPQTVSPKPVFLSLDAFVTHFCHRHKTISTTAFWFTLVSWLWRRSHMSAFT